jgi:hypothetical protein
LCAIFHPAWLLEGAVRESPLLGRSHPLARLLVSFLLFIGFPTPFIQLLIPYNQPLKPIYVKKALALIEQIEMESEEEDD